MKRSRRRSAARTFRRARRRAVGAARGLGKFLPAGTIQTVGGGVAGFVGLQMIVGKLADLPAVPASFKTGYGRIALKAAAAIAAGYFARRFAGRQIGNAIGTGALISVGLDVVNVAMNKPALSGYSPGGDNNYGVLPGPAGMNGYEPALAGYEEVEYAQ